MKIVMGSDPHGSGRTPKELEYSISVFEDAYELAVEQGATTVFWLGDLLHFKYGLELRLLLAWKDIIADYKRDHDINTIMIPGNHDKPWAELEGETSIRLLDGYGCQILSRPTTLIQEGVMYSFLPWLPYEEYQKEAKKLSIAAIQHKGLKFLFSHTPLAEGLVSASNHTVDTPIRVHHLYPESWDHIWLGDYHAHQTVGPKITYLGAPRPRTFGDWNNRGYWLLDVEYGRWGTKNLPLPSKYPEYIKLRISAFGPPTIPNYDPENHYRVECAMHWVAELGRKYKGVAIEHIPGESITPHKVRIPAQERNNPVAIAKRWREAQALDPSLDPLMEEYVNKCLHQTR